MKVEIIDKGVFSLIVDNGRLGRQREGFCQSGPMDTDAYLWANFLAFNSDNTPCIEAIGNVTVCVEDRCVVAVTGRDTAIYVNGSEHKAYGSIFLSSGDELRFGSRVFGAKAYLAIGGAWNVPNIVGSACTVPRESLGGLDTKGGVLQNGDSFDINTYDFSKRKTLRARRLSCDKSKNYDVNLPIRVIPGYQFELFSQVARQLFVTSEYTVTSAIDRMGFRLSGRNVACDSQKLRSEAIHIGAVQVPPDGQPIVMMRDRQTLGGYPKLGCVNPVDVNRLAQTVPGEKINFTYQNNEAARADSLLAINRRRQLQGELV